MSAASKMLLFAGFLAVAVLAACGQSDMHGEFTDQPPTRSAASAAPTRTPAPTSTPEQASADELAVAPDFTLPSANGSQVTLSELTAEQPVVLVFYRAFW